MSNALFSAYRRIVEQAWLPIFVADEWDTEILLEGCRRARLSAVEYTLRRRDAREVIPTLKSRLPDMAILMGSTVDSDEIVLERQTRYPQLMTLAELAPHVDGFVSMLPYSDGTLRKYGKTHLCIPTAENGGEALRQIQSGAAVIKETTIREHDKLRNWTRRGRYLQRTKALLTLPTEQAVPARLFRNIAYRKRPSI